MALSSRRAHRAAMPVLKRIILETMKELHSKPYPVNMADETSLVSNRLVKLMLRVTMRQHPTLRFVASCQTLQTIQVRMLKLLMKCCLRWWTMLKETKTVFSTKSVTFNNDLKLNVHSLSLKTGDLQNLAVVCFEIGKNITPTCLMQNKWTVVKHLPQLHYFIQRFGSFVNHHRQE